MDPSVIVALDLIFEEFPKFASTSAKVINHVWLFRLLSGVSARSGVARSSFGSRIISRN
jgi:hypothetical protein